MDLAELIDIELQRNRRVELVMAMDAYEGQCLAIRLENGKEYFVAWEVFEEADAGEYEIRRVKR